MVSYLERLRRDQRVIFAEIRSSRSPSKESKAVVFELVLRLGEQTNAADGKAVPPPERNATGVTGGPSPSTPAAKPVSSQRPLRLNRSFGGPHAEA